MKERDFYFDNAKFLLIIFVVLGHTISPLKDDSNFIKAIYEIIYFFHMPAFVIISGYFLKNSRSSSKHILKFAKYYMVMQGVYYLVMNFIGSDISLTFTKPYYTYWYLLCLVGWNLIFPHLKDIKGILCISVIVGILVGYDRDFGVFLSLSRLIVFFPFFLFGYFLKKENILYLRKSRWKYIIIGASIIIGIFLTSQDLVNHSLLFKNTSYADMGYEQWYAGIYRVFMYCINLLFSLVFFILVPLDRKPYTSLGTQTLYVFMAHGVILKSLDHLGFYKYFNTFGSYVILIILGILLAVVLSAGFEKIRSKK